ncbi:hypothetical protein CEE37_10095 [candidate division LCP-89 bacterium B3_LCP]|uniref:Uncharacterized protein n=1 Tax=candidate division LCP-89 bacterium B3_LCP TaxID=2012998 RepID=A0A532UYX4_UNCL8|nr:MAG: hypothetical protein CEE37_10095 [candidate division LCP-89 bacterium B3_LCP]
MSINLPDNCKKQLIAKLAEILQKLKVNNGLYIDVNSSMELYELDNIIQKKSEQKKEQKLRQKRELLNQYISDQPVRDYIYGLVSTELAQSNEYDDTKGINITSFPLFKDVQQVAERYISQLDSLPKDYFFTIKLENNIGCMLEEGEEYQVSNTVKLFKPSSKTIDRFPIPENVNHLDHLRYAFIDQIKWPTEWDANSVYIQIDMKGFISENIITRPIEETIMILKSFCGVSLATGLFQNFPPLRLSFEKSNSYFTVHKGSNEQLVFQRLFIFDENLSDYIQGLRIPQGIENLKKEQLIRLELIKHAFTEDDQSKRIKKACQWYFESQIGKNEILSFVQAVVVLEILLGKGSQHNEVGLGELIGNRSAYLIGDSHKKRKLILEKFREIYTTRSKIVHGGENRLDLKAKYLMYHLQEICEKVIYKELLLLYKDVK